MTQLRRRRKHSDLTAEAIKARNELQALLDSGEVKPGTREWRECKAAIKAMDASLGIAKRRAPP